ncbi:MAG TPA: DNA polymerase IV [Beijerinckiaceae bacterium]|nr:DNA polymerase IV [Beijerinckiaceae bacterium]
MTPAGGAACRDCLSPVPSRSSGMRCTACGSPRVVGHPELHELSIAHIDCDAFFAAIEKRDDPSLADRPVIIGGRTRGVVATACYVARTYGIRSAMPMFKALKACPDAVVIKPNIDKYRIVGRQVRALMLELTPLVEPVSIDEAFLDLSGTERLHHGSPAATLLRFARRVEAEVGITVSVGLSYNKFLAKLASDLDKPRGFAVIGKAEAPMFLAEKPVGLIPGVGAAAQARLAKAGITLMRHLPEAEPDRLFRALGREGQRLRRLAMGDDDRRVTPEHDTKSVSAETTFDTDLRAFEDLEPILWRLTERLALRLKRAGLAGGSVTLKLKDSRFQIKTRTRATSSPTQLASRLFEAGQQLLKPECDGTAYRLIGIGAGHLCEAALADKGDLADMGVVRDVRREAAIDALREKYGANAVQKGLALRPRQR